MLLYSIHIDQDKVFISIISKKNKSIDIKKNYTFYLANDVKPFYVPKNAVLVSCLSNFDVLIKELSVNATKQSSLKKTLPFQIESLCEIPSNEIIYAPILLETTKSSSSLHVHRAKSILKSLSLRTVSYAF